MTTAELDLPHRQNLASTLTARAQFLLAVSVAGLLAGTSGCSLLFVDGPPANHRKLNYFDCTSNNLAPVVDVVIGGAEGLGALGSGSTNSRYLTSADVIVPVAVALAFVAS